MTTLSLARLAEIEAAASNATPVAWLCGRTVDAFAAAGYETCEPSDYGAFPVYATLCDPQTVAALCRIAQVAVEWERVAVSPSEWDDFEQAELDLSNALRDAGLLE